MKIAFLLGKGRSGSTLFDMLLGTVPGVFAVGETTHVWAWPEPGMQACSCGRGLDDCPLWGPVIDATLTARGLTAPQASALQAEALGWSQLPRLLRGRPSTASIHYASLASELYRQLLAATGAKVIADSAKWPTHPAAWGLMDSEVVGIHLVRDPRAVAYSWAMPKRGAFQQDGESMPKHSSTQSAASWLVRNLAVERALRFLPGVRIRYEDLVDDPKAVVAEVAAVVGVVSEADDGSDTDVGQLHIASGNPDRFSAGPIRVVEDRRWLSGMSRLNAWLVTGLTWPLLTRYGYSVVPPREV